MCKCKQLDASKPSCKLAQLLYLHACGIVPCEMCCYLFARSFSHPMHFSRGGTDTPANCCPNVKATTTIALRCTCWFSPNHLRTLNCNAGAIRFNKAAYHDQTACMNAHLHAVCLAGTDNAWRNVAVLGLLAAIEVWEKVGDVRDTRRSFLDAPQACEYCTQPC